MTLSEFLLARIAEDEAKAREVEDAIPFTLHQPHLIYVSRGQAVASHPSRVLADCEAKRDVVRLCDALIADAEADSGHEGTTATANMAEEVLERLVQPYADHPNFDPSWRA